MIFEGAFCKSVGQRQRNLKGDKQLTGSCLKSTVLPFPADQKLSRPKLTQYSLFPKNRDTVHLSLRDLPDTEKKRTREIEIREKFDPHVT